MAGLCALHHTALRLCALAEAGESCAVHHCLEGLSVLRQRFVARLMGGIAHREPGAVRVLEELAFSASDDVRAEAYDALGRCPADLLVSPTERMSLRRESEPWVEVSRIRALGAAATRVPIRVSRALEVAAETPHGWVQREVFFVLDACLASGGNGIFHGVEGWFQSQVADVRETALLWMGSLVEPPMEVLLPAAMRLATDASPLVRAAAARVLSRHGMRDPEAAIPMLKSLAADRSHHLSRMEVARGLTHWQVSAPFEALTILRSLLNDSVGAVRGVALRRLYRLSKEHPAIALGVVREWHASRDVRRHAVTTCLRAVGRSRDPVIASQARLLLNEITRRSA